jgi:hypothetical protein
MKKNISETQLAEDFLRESLPLQGTFIRTITRANGETDRKTLPNIVTADGLNNLATRACTDNGSKYDWIAIGTENYTPHINTLANAAGKRLRLFLRRLN